MCVGGDSPPTHRTVMSGFRVIAHRGASEDAPDNTALAFQSAIDQAADAIETDVRLTSDHVLLLEHDGDVEGLDVATYPLEALEARRPGLITLAGAMRRFANRVPFVFEVKQPGIEAAVVRMAQDLLPPERFVATEFTSFWLPSALRLAKLAPACRVGWLTRDWSEKAIAMVAESGLGQICPPAAAVLATPALVGLAHDVGLDVRVWWVEDPAQVPRLAAHGVDGGTVNFPGRARAALAG